MKMNFVVIGLTIFSGSLMAAPFNGYIVKLKSNTNGLMAANSFKAFGDVKRNVKTNFGQFLKLETRAGLTDAGFNSLRNNPMIEYIEPNYIVSVGRKLSGAPSDSAFKKQWGLYNSTKKSEDINAMKAWEITEGSEEIRVAVIDTGVDYTHPDLASQIAINVSEKNGQAGVDDDGNGFIDDIYGYNFSAKTADPMDGHGHGTHCAGVIGAARNGTGIVGVMSKVKIIPIKFLSDSGSGETIDAISAIDYAIKRGAHVMSNSWGGGDHEQALMDAITSARNAGITFVAAAGNEYSNNDETPAYPASYNVDNVISVGAFTSTGSKSSFSNHGIKSVHVFAPGSNVYSTVNRGGYQSMSGTSMATPHVAGIVGLMLSKEPNLTPAEIRERLIRTSNQTAQLKSYSQSNGRVDAYRALMNK